MESSFPQSIGLWEEAQKHSQTQILIQSRGVGGMSKGQQLPSSISHET